MPSTFSTWRIPFSLQALAVVSAAYWLYAILLAPLLEPSAKLRLPVAAPAAASGSPSVFAANPELKDLFPPDAWERKTPMVLETKYGWLLLKQYETIDGNEETGQASELKLKPCTMVFFNVGEKNAGRARPIVMQAPEGARLQFDSEADIRRGKFGRLIQGALVGPVRVFSPPASREQNDGFELNTRDLQIKLDRIWTPHEVDFQFGANRGRGRDLIIRLGSEDDVPGSQRLGALRSLEMVQLESLQLEAPAKSLASSAPLASRKPPGNTMIDIACNGPFLFDFKQRLATLEGEVVVTQLPVVAEPDQLRCDRLTIHFAKPSADAAPENQGPRFAANLGAFQPERLTAIGRPVVLNAPSYNAFIQGGYLEYHLAENQIIASDEKKVVLKYGQMVFESPEVEYTLGADGRLGALWAEGGGVLQGVFGKNKPVPFVMRWGKSLRLRPHEGHRVLSAVGGVSAEIPKYGTANADEIHVWLRETPRVSVAPDANGLKHDIQPERFVALGNVSFDSPQLKVDTPRLEAWVEDTQRPLASSSPTGEKGAGVFGRKKQVQQQFKLSGQLVRLNFLRNVQTILLDALSIDGNVALEETRGVEQQATPFVAHGDSLQLVRASDPSAELTVYGQPVQLSGRGVHLTSSNVHVNRGQNRLWIEGPGSLTLNNLKSKARNTNKGSLDFVERITSTWRGGLTFNGSTVRLQQKVETRGAENIIFSSFLDVSLNQHIDFSKSQRVQGLEAARLTFSGGVFVDSRISDQGALTSWSQLQVKDIAFDRTAGRLYATGPGWMKSVQRSGGLLKSKTSTPARNEPPPLRFVRIDFARGITGQVLSPSFSRWKLDFQDNVVAMVGPVLRWDEVLTAKQLGPQGVVMYSDILSVTQTGIGPNKERLLEMEARSNSYVQVHGNLFDAKAAAIKYAAAKDLLVLEGGPRGDALVSRSEQANAPRIDSAARRILIWPRSNRIKVDGGSYLDLGPIGSAAPPQR